MFGLVSKHGALLYDPFTTPLFSFTTSTPVGVGVEILLEKMLLLLDDVHKEHLAFLNTVSIEGRLSFVDL